MLAHEVPSNIAADVLLNVTAPQSAFQYANQVHINKSVLTFLQPTVAIYIESMNINSEIIYRKSNKITLVNNNPKYVVIIFSRKTKLQTVENIETILKELKVDTYLEAVSNNKIHLYVSASTDNLLKFADEIELEKQTVSGSIRKFDYSRTSDFLVNGIKEHQILENCDKAYLIKDIIKPSLLCYIRNGTIKHFFPLHDSDYIENFNIKLNNPLPLNQIKGYFGTSIGLYFAFFQFYTISLIFPAIFGLLQYHLDFNVAIVCGFYVVWTTVFLELWKRKCSGLSYLWGTIEMSSLDQPRTAYYGELKPDPITGKMTRQYPMKYTYIQMYCKSYPIVAICVFAAAYFAAYQFQIEAQLIRNFGTDSLLLYIPVVIQSVLIAIFSWLYEKLATYLTNQENHRTRSQYERHRVNKLMIFEIVNNFFSLFYIAFILRDLNQLKSQLMTQLIIFQIVQVIQEIGFPLVSVLKQKYTQNSKEYLVEGSEVQNIDLFMQTKYESGLNEYYSTYEDYLQLCTQFGYIVLFPSFAPFAASFALVSNIFGVYIDFIKLTKFYRRPFARQSKNIGAWQSAFEVLSLLAVFSNFGLLYLQPDIRTFIGNLFPSVSDFSFVIIEHILLGIKFCLHKTIPDIPRWVRIAKAKGDYESIQALKNSRQSKYFKKFD